jgi:hypothetical protein
MVAVAGLRLAVIGWSWTTDPQTAVTDQGAVDLGGHAPVGVQVHAPRVPKAPNRSESPHPRDATCGIVRPLTATVVGLRCGGKRGHVRRRMVAPLPSHGRGHRFETCHAYEGHLQRGKLMVFCLRLSRAVFRRATEQHVQAVTSAVSDSGSRWP